MGQERQFKCDWCGYVMTEQQCKVICRNCGARWDCSDLTIHLADIPESPRPTNQALHRQPVVGDG